MRNTLTTEFAEGMREISKDIVMSTQAIQTYLKEGKLGYSDLIDMSQKYRSEQEKEVDYNEKLAKQAETIKGDAAKKGNLSASDPSLGNSGPRSMRKRKRKKLTDEGIGQADAASNTTISIENQNIGVAQEVPRDGNAGTKREQLVEIAPPDELDFHSGSWWISGKCGRLPSFPLPRASNLFRQYRRLLLTGFAATLLLVILQSSSCSFIDP